jgi:hypothetical protein
VTGYGTARRRAWQVMLVVLLLALPGGRGALRADDTPAPNNAPPAAPAPPAATPAPAPDNQPDQIGRSILVVNDVDGQFGDAPAKHLAVNDDIVFAEDITTGADAKTVLEFRDGSTFEIGPDAAVRIDSFVFNPEESTSHKTIDVSRGVFRYVSGFVASDQDAKITTPSGQMGIRGSVVEGIVDPSVPNFVYVGEGVGTFTNGAGSSDLPAGSAIAVPSATTPPMAPAAMPPAVAQQAVDVIERHLPPNAQSRPPADDVWLKQSGTADLVPVAEQRQRQAAIAVRPFVPPAPRGSLAGELGLLSEGSRVGLFRGGQTPRTPDQNEFLARMARDHPGAAAAMARYRTQAQTMHRASMAAGTALVIHGVGRAAPSPEVMHRVTAAAVRANPAAAPAINRHASEALHARETGERNRPNTEERNRFEERNRHEGTAPSHPPERRVEPPRGAPVQNREQHVNPQNQQRQPPGNVGTKPPRPSPPAKQPPAKQPPGKKKEENQR